MNTASILMIKYIGIATVLTFLISLFLIKFVIEYSKKHKLLDEPNERSSHKTSTPTMGGVGIVIGMFITNIIANIFFHFQFSWYIVISYLALMIIGIWDDMSNLKPTHKLLVEILIAILMFYEGVFINDMHGYFGLYILPGWLSIAINIFLIVGVVNAFNLIDGIDGLAGGLGLINSIVFGILFYAKGDFQFAMLSFVLAGGLIGFLYFNFHPAKIFMGDTGSLVLGFMMVVFSIRIFNFHEVVIFHKAVQTILIVPALLLIPIYDMCRLFIERILNGKHPFYADRNHIHHLLLKHGMCPKKASLILWIINIKLILLACIMYFINIYLGLIILFLIIIMVSESMTILSLVKNFARMVKFRRVLNRNLNENVLLNSIAFRS